MLTTALLVAGNASNAYAHPGHVPEPHDLWTAWSFAPGVVLALALSGACYAIGVRALWHRAGSGRGVARAHVVAFAFGLLVLSLALLSPIDTISEALFSVHMAQHLLLVAVAAPLLVLGAPEYVMMWVLPLAPRRSIARWWHRARWVGVCRALLTHPIVAWSVHVLTLWVWHAPRLYDAALADTRVHVLEHTSFLLTALLFWWSVFRGRMSLGTSTLYLFAAALQGTLLGALLTLAHRPWYSGHLVSTQAWGLTPLEDQQMAGLIMWVPAGLVYLLALVPRWVRVLALEPGDQSLGGGSVALLRRSAVHQCTSGTP